MSEPKFMLEWIPTTALKEFIAHHWYYLPESLEKDNAAWIATMIDLLCEIRSRGMSVELKIEDKED